MEVDKKKEIFDAAQSLFAQFGLKKITTDDIAHEARVSKATIYKCYRNKSQIFDEVVETEAEQLLKVIRAAVDEAPTVADKFKAHLFTRMERIGEFINFYRVTRESDGVEIARAHTALVCFDYARQRVCRAPAAFRAAARRGGRSGAEDGDRPGGDSEICPPSGSDRLRPLGARLRTSRGWGTVADS